MTLPTGVGPGGRREGAGRPKGSLNKETRRILLAAQEAGRTLPLEFLLSCMDNAELGLRDRIFCAVATMPYMHSRRATRIGITTELDDEELAQQLAAAEAAFAALPEVERAERLDHRIDDLVADIDQLGRDRQRVLFRRMIEAAESSLADLAMAVMSPRHAPGGGQVTKLVTRP